jgi:hypothetical protein
MKKEQKLHGNSGYGFLSIHEANTVVLPVSAIDLQIATLVYSFHLEYCLVMLSALSKFHTYTSGVIQILVHYIIILQPKFPTSI